MVATDLVPETLMIAQAHNWLSRAIWSMLLIASIWVFYVLALQYSACRADGSGQLVCLFSALILGCLEVLGLIVRTAIKLTLMILP